MHIGIDFDNTIVCYDALFHKVCVEKGLVPATTPQSKTEVRDHLRRVGREEAWTEIQGYVYGARMAEADAYPGVREFFATCRSKGIPVSIISHKTKHPFLGPQYDLHAAALDWLERQGFLDPNQLGVPRSHVYFELTKEAKLNRIAAAGATHFIDDLPEILKAKEFPAGVKRILFDPNNLCAKEEALTRANSWDGMPALLI